MTLKDWIKSIHNYAQNYRKSPSKVSLTESVCQRISYMHYMCHSCKGRWQIKESNSTRNTFYCPWCGTKQTFDHNKGG